MTVRSVGRGVVVPAAIAVLSVVFLWNLVWSAADQVIQTPDIQWYFVWLHQYVRDEFFAGRVPLWNPYNFGGMPLAANPQATAFYPLSWLHLAMPVGLAERLMIVGHCAMAGIFMLLCLRCMRVGRAAAIFGALPYMFGNYFMANATVGHLTMVFTMAWLPLIVMCVECAISTRRLRWAVLGGMAMGMQLLAGEPQNSYYTILTVVVYGLVRVLSSLADGDTATADGSLKRLLHMAGVLAVVGLVAGGAAAIQIVPTAEFAAHSDRGDANFDFATHMSFPANSAMEMIVPWENDNTYSLRVIGTPLEFRRNWEFAGYAGILTLAMAGVSVTLRGKPRLRAAKILLLVAIVLMLGRHTPMYAILYQALPGLNLFRIPARAMVIAQFALAVMAAFGFERIAHSTHKSQTATVRLIVFAMLALTLITLVGLVVGPGLHRVILHADSLTETTQKLVLTDARIIVPCLCITGSAVILLFAMRLRASLTMALLIFGLGMDLYVNRPNIALQPFDVHTDPSVELFERLSSMMTVAQPARLDLPPRMLNANAAMAARVECLNGYSPITLGSFLRFVHDLRGCEISQSGRHELPDKLYNGTSPPTLLNVGLTAYRAAAATDYTIAPLNRTMPRAWVAHQCEPVSDVSAAIARLRVPTFDSATTVLLESGCVNSSFDGWPANSHVGFERLAPAEAVIHTSTSRDGWLVLSEMFYPGWKATVDGRSVEVVRAYGVLAAVPITAGEHSIRYWYQPLSFRIGWIATLITWTAALVGALVSLVGRQSAGALKRRCVSIAR